jgi:protoporphyrin/coproporphyrin ferrochelatase
MGAPDSLSDMKTFLQRMFCDPNIIPLKKPLRYLVAWIISTARHKKSWAKYQLIGGSPLKKSCNEIALELQKSTNTETFVAYSYSNPSINEVLETMNIKGITEITVLPMYPQWSFSTTRSVLQDIERVMPKSITYRLIKEYYTEPLFIQFWVKQIQKTIDSTGVKNPTLVFSAHSVPQYHIDQGDSYEKAIHESGKLIADSMNLPYHVSFQSKIGRMKWVEPATITMLKNLSFDGVEEILIIPISFLTENLETLYDIDTEIIPQFKSTFKTIEKVSLVDSAENLIPLFQNITSK